MAQVRDGLTAVEDGAGIRRLEGLAHLEVRGRHRGRFIHNMTTCQIKALEPGDGNFGMVIDVKGKLVAQLVIEAHDEHLILEGAAPALEGAHQQFVRYRVADDVRFLPVTDRAVLAVVGPEARALVGAPADAKPGAWSMGQIAGQDVTLRRNDLRLGRPGWDVVASTEGAPVVEGALIGAGAVALDEGTWEALRVAAGAPRDGLDMDETNVPLESTYLYETVDWDKGCYIGQEVIAMMHYRGRPNKQLMGVRFEAGAALPDPKDPLEDDGGKTVGRVGSAVVHPLLGPIGLAIVKRKAAVAGAVVQLPGGRTATLADLPFEAPVV